MKNLDALAVEKKTASELAEMVATTIGISAAWRERAVPRNMCPRRNLAAHAMLSSVN